MALDQFMALRDRKPVDITPPSLVTHLVHWKPQANAFSGHANGGPETPGSFSPTEFTTHLRAIHRDLYPDCDEKEVAHRRRAAQVEIATLDHCIIRDKAGHAFCRIRNHLEFYSFTFFSRRRHDLAYMPPIVANSPLFTASNSLKLGLQIGIIDASAFRCVPPHLYPQELIKRLMELFCLQEQPVPGMSQGDPGMSQGDQWNIFDRLCGSALVTASPGAPGSVKEDAYVWGYFEPDENGFCKVLVVNAGREDARLGRLVRRIIDAIAYTGLGSEARDDARGQLAFMKEKLLNLRAIIEDASSPACDHGALFNRISRQAQEVSQKVSSTRASFTRSVAYWEIVSQRIAELNEQPIAGFSRLGRIVTRNSKPIRDNCAMAIECQTGMAKQVEQASAILRTKVDVSRQKKVAAIDMTSKVIAAVGSAYAVPNIIVQYAGWLGDWTTISKFWWSVGVFVVMMSALFLAPKVESVLNKK